MNCIERIIELHQGKHFSSIVAHQQMLLSEYRTLSADEGHNLATVAIQEIDNGNLDKAETILLHLACLVPHSLDRLHSELTSRSFFYPYEIYLGADEKAAQILLDRVEWDSKNRNNLLCAAAWAGNEIVWKRFSAWRDNPPAWRSSLYVPPEAYAQEAGWILTPDNKRRNLFYDECYTVVLADNSSLPEAGSPVRIALPNNAQCKWCDRQLTVIFDINPVCTQLDFLPAISERLRFLMCDRCSCYGTMFFDLRTDGVAIWSTHNSRPEFINMGEWDKLPENKMCLGVARRSPYEAHQFVMQVGMSQIGGHPAWIQDAQYPQCPGCGDLMMFIVQLQKDDLEEFSEGTTYCFLCTNCRITAVNYQQT